ncbi:MAG: hypothetical protein ACI9XK_001640 [Granulosicoccus sp.]|jgi:hypothetical protein
MENGCAGTLCTTRKYDLEAGALTLMTSSAQGQDIFRIAERINPKRAFLFVSTILGRHIPVDPVEHRAALSKMAEGVSAHLLKGPVFVMGFAETAVGVGAGVFDSLRLANPEHDMGYLTTTRFSATGSQDWFTIEESHSHAVDHVILVPQSGVMRHGPDATLVLVDDETTTGKTFSELASGLCAKSLQFGRVVLVTLTDWSDGCAEEAVSGIFEGADVCSVSLQKGSWTWTPKLNRAPAVLPGAIEAYLPPWMPDVEQVFAAPRVGIDSSVERQTGEGILADLEGLGLRTPGPEDKVLVVGAGEHVWQPMLAAEALCERGVYTRFITTTRSPILQGKTIRHKVSFPDHYGHGFWMYMHNVVPSEWDRILFFTETGVEGLSADLVAWLGQVDVIDGAGSVTVLKPAAGAL